MNFDISILLRHNVIDCCSVWNILTSNRIYSASMEAGFNFLFSNYVEYECLYKKRTGTNINDLRLKLKKEMEKKKINCFKLSIDDLQEIAALEERKRLGIGELSSIALAKKLNQTFLTDDKKARELGEIILGKHKVQTTPRIVGVFFYHRFLIDSDISVIIDEHQSSLTSKWGDLTRFFNDMYQESLRRRSMEMQSFK